MKRKGLFIGILMGLIALSSCLISIGALIAHELAYNTSSFIGELFSIDSYYAEHFTTDLIFLGITGIGYWLALGKIKNEVLSYVLLLAFMISLFVFGSDLLLQLSSVTMENPDGQSELLIFEKVLLTSIIYPISGLIYDWKRSKKFNPENN
ncbi:hypothetical protein ACM46_09520 [Chryseobacterium angstadtii]|uniref:Lipoprotein n=1 Tax=Chryseobacterium angstadtii TaxID=558151 RepID=A0A0J7IEZ2_9FLAO|nr:hypothetical protein [Chryseobacterium angstadtii]KMQ64496.1 hypothetical protein ACM46_09520 [Chryseobacterium angstadtii]